MKIKNSLRGGIEYMLLSYSGNSEFPDFNDGAGTKTLWRLSHGKRSKAVEIVQEFIKHQTNLKVEWDDIEFDTVVAEIMGDGCEVEWVEF